MPLKSVSRRKLGKLVKQLSDQKLSGVVFIKTETQRATALRFSAGKLVHVNARGNSIEDAIKVLRQSTEYIFTFSPMEVDSEPELMQVSEFLARLEQTANDDTDISLGAIKLDGNSENAPEYDREVLHAILVQLVVSDIGPVAAMIVDQAIDDGGTIGNIINLIADYVPDTESANRFIELAMENSKQAYK